MPALLTFDEVYPRSLEEWLDGYRRDANPESEVQWWERLARCYTTYNQTNSLTGDQKQALFRILFMLGMGISETEKLEADLASLPADALEDIMGLLWERTQ